ncbi:MAG: zinc ribbon domain-containing protein [Eggerthellaceae bacterium]|nr:zinc ribbon domain-containing protein [Eggerthellaceae bacterium]
MFCTNCGAELKEGETICPKCKAPIPQNQAIGSSSGTPSQTQPPASPVPTATIAETAAAAPQSPKRGFFSSKRNIAIVCGAAVAVIVIIIAVIFSTGALVMGQTPDKFKTAFENDSIATNGIAKNDYLNDSTYTVTSFKAENIKKVNEFEVTADITATIENDNFKTDIQAVGAYYDATKSQNEVAQALLSQGYMFEVTSSTTTPKKGIDFDKTNGLDAANSVLSDDATSCTVDVNKSNSFWFADSTIDTHYTYTFDGTEWKFSNKDESDQFTYKKDIEGNYAAKVSSSLAQLQKFTISNLNTEKGTFQIDYSLLATPAGAQDTTVTGTIQATIDPSQQSNSSNGKQADGKLYYFEGTGTSDSGDGQAEIKGYFTTSKSGESSIELSTFSADLSYPGFFNTTMNSTTYFDETIYKQ